MSANKKTRSLWGSRSEAQRIYYQRQTIKRLEKENNQLKEQRQEFKKWVSDYRYNKTGSNEDGRYCVAISVTDILNKLNELEGKNERKS